MKVLLLGANGMLGQALKRQMRLSGTECHCADRTEAEYSFDLLDDQKLEKCISEVIPDVVINTAAVVSIEQCEEDPGKAYCLNSRLPSVLSGLCRKYQSYLIHISTDHFYTGGGKSLHNETDDVQLINEYARTKYIGEQMAMMHRDSLVLRTNIVGFRGRGQLTFLEWVLSEVRNGHKMTLFTDFYTSSIHTADFSRILMDVISCHPAGIYNLASSEVSDKKEFILAVCDSLLGKRPDYTEGSIKQLDGVARGSSLGLDTQKIENLLGYRMPSLEETVQSIAREYQERIVENEVSHICKY